MNGSRILIFSFVLAIDLALLFSLFRFGAGIFEVHMLDVGQGDAILLRSDEGHNILIDGGPGNEVILELSKVLPYLFSEIDLLVLTHPHADHVEGLIPILSRFEVGAVLLSAPEYGSLAYKKFLEEIGDMELYFAESGVDFRFGNLLIDVLYPFQPVTGLKMKNINNASPIMLVSNLNRRENGSGFRILLSGDAEEESEKALLETLSNPSETLEADIIKAGHHGSRTAGSTDFLNAVKAEIMLISCGKGNSFGHPHEETLEKADDMDMQVLRSDLEGGISIVFHKTRKSGPVMSGGSNGSSQSNGPGKVAESGISAQSGESGESGGSKLSGFPGYLHFDYLRPVYSRIRSILAPRLRSFSSRES